MGAENPSIKKPQESLVVKLAGPMIFFIPFSASHCSQVSNKRLAIHQVNSIG